MLDAAIETLGPTGLAALQEDRLQTQWAYVRERSALYRGRLPERISLDALREVGFTDKEELRASQEAPPPFGDDVAADVADVIDVARVEVQAGRLLALRAEDEALGRTAHKTSYVERHP